MLTDMPPQSKEAPVMKKHEPGRPFPFVNHFKGGIPPPPKNCPEFKPKEGTQNTIDSNKARTFDGMNREPQRNQQNNMAKNLHRNLND